MEEFYIDVELSRGLTRIQVDEVPPEQWDMPYTPQFIIEFRDGNEFITLTLQLEDGHWYDRSARLPDDDYPRPPDAEPTDPYYQSPLTAQAIQAVGEAISRHMIVHLTAYMGLFVPVFRTPTLN
ncbi:hypothetical protein [Mucilaginibacter pedocola]|uniref:Uncharacterized protein n=1 Tax=Mucilaginibacter pedocola TaxID=1792845 RepID=A0A1S9PLU9_9SPHI|nr:hypothetical protein [Mucilaginibacter pedocola]OOQ61915.1 hypothetical protein BC343_02305 [Mucilaginibacter pedocola]